MESFFESVHCAGEPDVQAANRGTTDRIQPLLREDRADRKAAGGAIAGGLHPHDVPTGL